ncbi:MAG TPA: DUF2283 domain-containing protein [Methylomirabilota bacterium]|nr:DUF2283 domain-containing protein [Methylomirabilota bacterium]
MNFVYSTDADALYVELEAVRRVARTVEISPSCLVDLDAEGRPLGIELLNPATSYQSIAEVLTRWALSREQTAALLAFPYQSLTPRPQSTSSAASGRVEFEGRRGELLTCA